MTESVEIIDKNRHQVYNNKQIKDNYAEQGCSVAGFRIFLWANPFFNF